MNDHDMLDPLKAKDERLVLLSCEIGYRAHENGMSLESAKQQLLMTYRGTNKADMPEKKQ